MARLDAPWLTAAPARKLFDALTTDGAELFFVGGCVRNALLGAPVKDFDLATNAKPEDTIGLAKAAGLKAIPTGIDHGTITVVAEGVPFEVTTFRDDVETDGRHAKVRFSARLEDDAQRRDFTMNALYADQAGKITDPTGGLSDLAARRVRFIGHGPDRIAEDYLRIMRFFRFHAWYGAAGDIDADGLAACAEGLEGLGRVSKERIGQELLRLLAAPDPAPAMSSFAAIGGLVQILPGADAASLPVLVHLEGGAGLGPDPIRRLAALGGVDRQENLRLSNDDAHRAGLLREVATSDMGAGEAGYRHGSEAASSALVLRAALMGQALDDGALARAKHGAAQTFALRAADFPDLSGKALGDALKAAEARWIASGFELSKRDLI